MVALYTKGSAFCEPTSQYGEIAKFREGGENLCIRYAHKLKEYNF